MRRMAPPRAHEGLVHVQVTLKVVSQRAASCFDAPEVGRWWMWIPRQRDHTDALVRQPIQIAEMVLIRIGDKQVIHLRTP